MLDCLSCRMMHVKARSSVVEHHLDMVGVGGSKPLVPKIIFGEEKSMFGPLHC